MKYNLFTNYINRFTFRKKKPGNLTKFIFFARSKLDSKWSNIFPVQRFLAVNSLPGEYEVNSKDIPEVELLLVTKSDDSELLKYIIPFAILNCENRISKITIIVPEVSVSSVIHILKDEKYFEIVSVKNENDVIPDRIRQSLHDEFKSLYGWVLAQYLKIWSVAQSEAKGVLVLDADTLLLNKRKFLFNSGMQILTPTLEYNSPYYEFLKKFDGFFGECVNSYIPHHMLMQPVFARQALDYWENSIDKMHSDVLRIYDRNTSSPFCLCFEVYAQYMMTHHSSKVVLVKWSNLSVPREKILNKDLDKLLEYYKKRYNSISLHSWL